MLAPGSCLPPKQLPLFAGVLRLLIEVDWTLVLVLCRQATLSRACKPWLVVLLTDAERTYGLLGMARMIVAVVDMVTTGMIQQATNALALFGIGTIYHNCARIDGKNAVRGVRSCS